MATLNLVYGTIENPAAALVRERGRWAARPGIGPMSASLAEGVPALRLNTPGWMNVSPDVVQTLAGTEALTDYCRDRLVNRVPIFSLVIRSFIAAYFDHVAKEVEHRRDELEARLDAAGFRVSSGFPTYRDWIFSALLPVPQVYIATAVPGGSDAFVAMDVLFWTGRGPVALALESGSMPTARSLRGRRALLSSHPEMTLGAIKVPSDGRSWAFEEELDHLLDGDLLPCAGLPFGPYRCFDEEALV